LRSWQFALCYRRWRISWSFCWSGSREAAP
jgi:hypothetical protein